MRRPQPFVFLIFVAALLVGALVVVSTFMSTGPVENQPRSPSENSASKSAP